jgi:hypothetical protein
MVVIHRAARFVRIGLGLFATLGCGSEPAASQGSGGSGAAAGPGQTVPSARVPGTGGVTTQGTGGANALPASPPVTTVPTAGSASAMAGSLAGQAGSGGATAQPAAGRLPPVDNVDGPGPFETSIVMNIPPDDGWVVHPTDLGADGLLHPIFLWGPGGGAAPSNYEDYLLRPIASHGFVVFSAVSTGNGQEMIAGLDWLVAENERSDSPFYQKLDTAKVGAGGHSQGSVTTFAAAPDKRILTTIHVAGGSFDGNGPAALSGPTAYICGETDTLATGNCMRDYMVTTVPVFYTLMSDVGHIPAADEGSAAIIAWLRWQLGGEEDRRSNFIGPDCDFCTGKWVSQTKNW